jgi:oligopeptide transport system ATP-binding protein
MRQRVMIAMALSCRPKLVLADEPTTALDVTIQAQILELLATLGRELNTAYILITHDLGVIAGMTKRAYVMYAGQIVESASTSDLFANPRMPYTWGLLSAVPRFDEQRQQRLLPIEGQPPDLADRTPGCRFAPRCRFARTICTEREPTLIRPSAAAPTHEVRCWATQPGGWLSESHWQVAVAAAAEVNRVENQTLGTL